MPERQVANPDRADADALEAGDAQPDQFAHAPNLPLASFAENETELIVVELFDYRRFQLPRIEAEAVVQEGEAFGVDEDPPRVMSASASRREQRPRRPSAWRSRRRKVPR